jgi:hypothetical protein
MRVLLNNTKEAVAISTWPFKACTIGTGAGAVGLSAKCQKRTSFISLVAACPFDKAHFLSAFRSDRYLRAYKNQARLKEKSGISSRSLADEKVCDRWRKRENATLKKLEILAFGLAIIPLLASTWWIADSTKKTEALNPDQIWLAD